MRQVAISFSQIIAKKICDLKERWRAATLSLSATFDATLFPYITCDHEWALLTFDLNHITMYLLWRDDCECKQTLHHDWPIKYIEFLYNVFNSLSLSLTNATIIIIRAKSLKLKDSRNFYDLRFIERIQLIIWQKQTAAERRPPPSDSESTMILFSNIFAQNISLDCENVSQHRNIWQHFVLSSNSHRLSVLLDVYENYSRNLENFNVVSG